MEILKGMPVTKQLQYKAQTVLRDNLGLNVYPDDVVIEDFFIPKESENVVSMVSFSIKGHDYIWYHYHDLTGKFSIVNSTDWSVLNVPQKVGD